MSDISQVYRQKKKEFHPAVFWINVEGAPLEICRKDPLINIIFWQTSNFVWCTNPFQYWPNAWSIKENNGERKNIKTTQKNFLWETDINTSDRRIQYCLDKRFLQGIKGVNSKNRPCNLVLEDEAGRPVWKISLCWLSIKIVTWLLSGVSNELSPLSPVGCWSLFYEGNLGDCSCY